MTENYLHQSTDEIEYFKVKMFRSNMDSIPSYPLPSGYTIQLYKPNSNDDQTWAEIATAAGEFRSIQQGRYIGTAMAWSAELDGEAQGSLYWLSIIPEYQGKKLAKPLVSTVLKRISEYSRKILLD